MRALFPVLENYFLSVFCEVWGEGELWDVEERWKVF